MKKEDNNMFVKFVGAVDSTLTSPNSRNNLSTPLTAPTNNFYKNM